MYIGRHSDLLFLATVVGNAICTENEEYEVPVIISYDELDNEYLIKDIINALIKQYPYFYYVEKIVDATGYVWFDANKGNLTMTEVEEDVFEVTEDDWDDYEEDYEITSADLHDYMYGI